MPIRKVTLYQIELPQLETRSISGGRKVTALDSTILSIEVDDGSIGWGETCPWGPAYLPYCAEGLRSTLQVLAPRLIGADPTNIAAVHILMDEALRGQGPAKSAIDMACWDLLGKMLKAPVHQLLGGLLAESMPCTNFLARENGWDDMAARIHDRRADGRSHLEVKAVGDPAADVELIRFIADRMEPHELLKVDANGGWQVHEAQRVMAAAPETAIIFEQPCATYEQCKALRRLTDRPIFLDETAVTLEDVARGFFDGVANGINLKIARVGGLIKARAIRDLCLGLGLPLIVQCVGGSDITNAAIAHLGHTVPPNSLLSTWDAAAMLSVRTAEGMPRLEGRLKAGAGPGLGITPLPEVLSEPFAIYD